MKVIKILEVIVGLVILMIPDPAEPITIPLALALIADGFGVME